MPIKPSYGGITIHLREDSTFGITLHPIRFLGERNKDLKLDKVHEIEINQNSGDYKITFTISKLS